MVSILFATLLLGGCGSNPTSNSGPIVATVVGAGVTGTAAASPTSAQSTAGANPDLIATAVRQTVVALGNQTGASPTAAPASVTIAPTIGVTATPTPAPIATPTPQPSTATPKPAAGSVLYQVNATTGFTDWSGPACWKKLNAMLLNDGSCLGYKTWSGAPFQPGDVGDYAVEAQMQLNGTSGYFGLVARATGIGDESGYFALINVDPGAGYANVTSVNGPLFKNAPSPIQADSKVHTLRLEVRGNTIRFLVDGALVIEAQDNKYLNAGRVGVYGERCSFTVRTFEVIAL